MHTIQIRRNTLIQFKRKYAKEGWSLPEVASAQHWLRALLTTSDGWEWMLIDDDEGSKREALKQLTILMLHAKKTGEESEYRRLDRIFTVYYHVYIYKRSITHPCVARLIQACKADAGAINVLPGKDDRH